MITLIIIFILSLIGACGLVYLKVEELSVGERVVLKEVRGRIDHFTEVLPRQLKQSARLLLARISLKVHELTTWAHNFIGALRGFFRRYTIKLFASAHSHANSDTGVPIVSSFWQRMRNSKKDLNQK